jgi:hypothetical protein
LTTRAIDEAWLSKIEQVDNIFPNIDCKYWRGIKN